MSLPVTPDNIEENYKEINRHGFVVDTRGPRATLIRGMQTWSFATRVEAIIFALKRIEEERAEGN